MKRLSKDNESLQAVLKSSSIQTAGPERVGDLFPSRLENYLLVEVLYDDSVVVAGERKKWHVSNEGAFSKAQVDLLIEILKPFTPGHQIICYYSDLALFTDDESVLAKLDAFPRPVAYSCTLEELPALISLPENDFTPSLWWAADRSWFFYNDVDLSVAIFGGSDQVANALKGTPFKTAEISPDISTQTVSKMQGEFYSDVKGRK